MKIIRKKNTVKASKSYNRKRPIKASTGGDMLEDIRLSKDAYIQRWSEDYEGTPATSWENIWDNVVNEFELYADDEASSHSDDRGMYGPTIKERFDSGEIDAEDVEYEFDEWVMWLDLSDYDYAD